MTILNLEISFKIQPSETTFKINDSLWSSIVANNNTYMGYNGEDRFSCQQMLIYTTAVCFLLPNSSH
ncbi:MAG TPA: hypothetical protein VK766_11060 [Cytophagaceae bacterium]|nr:hypothetical protein [Cytophagaceae bacterium]